MNSFQTWEIIIMTTKFDENWSNEEEGRGKEKEGVMRGVMGYVRKLKCQNEPLVNLLNFFSLVKLYSQNFFPQSCSVAFFTNYFFELIFPCI